jgi:hypothetical protein
MDTITLKKILLEEMQKYAGEGLNAYSYLTENEPEQIYTVIDIATIRDRRLVSTVLIARLLDNRIVIELDHNNKELVDALKARGVPADQIILAYRGDPVPA